MNIGMGSWSQYNHRQIIGSLGMRQLIMEHSHLCVSI